MTTTPNWDTPPGTIIDGHDATPPSVNLKCIVYHLHAKHKICSGAFMPCLVH